MAFGSDPDHHKIYKLGAYLYWARESTTKYWVHYGDQVQLYFHMKDTAEIVWDFVEVLTSGAAQFTPASDGSGSGAGCPSQNVSACTPCKNGGACGWIQDWFVN